MLSSRCPSKNPIELRTSVARRVEGTAANLRHSAVALLNHYPRGVGVERAIGGEGMGQRLAAVIDAADENEFALAADEDRALQMAHVEKQKRFIVKNFVDKRTRKH